MILQLLVVVILLFLLSWGRRGIEGFADALAKHNAFVEESQKKLNPLTNLVNLTQPVAPVGQKTAQQFYDATYHLEAKPTSGSYALKADTVYEVPSELPTGLQRAIGCQNAPKTCAAFDKAEFREHCGMSFDKQGIASDGSPHIGGMYVSPDDRAYQTGAAQKVLDERLPPYDPYRVYQPSIGTAKPGAFALTKDQCVVVKEKVDCQEKQSFNSPNCTQCFPSQGFSRVAADSPRLPSVLYLAGKGTLRIESRDEPRLARSSGIPLDPTTPFRLDLPASSEGKTFTILVGEDGRKPTYVSGYLEGDTPRGKYKIDMNILIARDLELGTRPRMSGMSRVQGFRCLSFVPGPKKKAMRLSCMMPLSFLDIYDPEAIYCDNGPLVTKEASAIHIESDPCYAKGNAVGNYKLECLQSRWIALGGTVDGTGYPNTQEKADALQKVGGKGLHLDDIMERLGDKMMEAITGKRMSGVAMTIPEWNDLSMWGLGIPIKSPCDGLQKDEGPLTDACLNYLYRNQGSGTHIGNTYTLPSNQMASLKEGFATADPVPSTFLYPGTAIDPKTPSGLAFGENLGGVEAAKAELDRIHRQANDNTKTNTQRADAIQKAYGVVLPPATSNKVTGPVQVFAVGPGYQHTRAEAAGVCAKYGARVATAAELEEAQRNGADWCFSGWVAEGVGQWPNSTSPVWGCGGRLGVISWTPGDRAGVNCYGPKPDPTAEPAGVIKPFNGDFWNQPNEKTYVTIPSGYLETTGVQNCFSGLSPDQAKAACDRLGGQCAGFSYSKDGAGHGCYKGNHAGGLNTNGAYMGYVKIPTATNQPVDGRYIRLQYNRREALNLAQILVYSREGGPNLITASTPVTQSSQHSYFSPNQIVNQRGSQWYNFAHTSGSDIPWLEVDLGAMTRIHKIVVWNRQDCCQSRILGMTVSVLNAEKEAVYISNPIRTTNQSYTWMPPNGEVLVDRDPIRRQTPFQPTGWRCLGGMPAPLRRNNDGEIECMSMNAKDCLWGDHNSCLRFATSPPGGIQPLVCGADHARKWGGPGYDSGAHWCARADRIL